jgi:hypothetical protein
MPAVGTLWVKDRNFKLSDRSWISWAGKCHSIACEIRDGAKLGDAYLVGHDQTLPNAAMYQESGSSGFKRILLGIAQGDHFFYGRSVARGGLAGVHRSVEREIVIRASVKDWRRVGGWMIPHGEFFREEGGDSRSFAGVTEIDREGFSDPQFGDAWYGYINWDDPGPHRRESGISAFLSGISGSPVFLQRSVHRAPLEESDRDIGYRSHENQSLKRSLKELLGSSTILKPIDDVAPALSESHVAQIWALRPLLEIGVIVGIVATSIGFAALVLRMPQV